MAREDERPVQQSVLDRLIDEDPERLHEYPLTRLQSVRALKTAVRRDLEWLLNSRAIAHKAPSGFEQLNKSVYTYGIADITSLSADNADDRAELMNRIQRAVALFEPRLGRVRVSEVPQIDEKARQVRFQIEAVLKLDPSPEYVVFDTVLDVASGQYAVKGESGA
jgi:type VI secretion system protein ImpF